MYADAIETVSVARSTGCSSPQRAAVVRRTRATSANPMDREGVALSVARPRGHDRADDPENRKDDPDDEEHDVSVAKRQHSSGDEQDQIQDPESAEPEPRE